MFRLNWPGDTELIFGQYWSMFCDYYAEVIEDGPFMALGTPTARLPQIRFTQGFLDGGGGHWTLAGLVGSANPIGGSSSDPYNASTNAGEDAETPQLQAQVKYQADLWGKAAFYGHPQAFTASVTAGWERAVSRFTGTGGTALANLQGGATNGIFANTYINPWLLMGSLFIPIIPTHTDNLAGTMHLIVQPWVGADVDAFGFTGDSTNVFKYNNNTFGGNHLQFNEEALERWGILGEVQYYFTNQWYLNTAYGFSKTLGFNDGWEDYYTNSATAGIGSQVTAQQEVDATLWWRPIAALKFGVQYSFVHSQYAADATGAGVFPVPGTAQGSFSKQGDEHRVEFAGYFYF